VALARRAARFPAAARVRKRAEFLRIQGAGRRVTTRHFVMILAPSAEPDGLARLGITASRKIGGAVVRSRAKRLVRVAFRSTPELWPRGGDVVVMVRTALDALKADDVIQEWLEVAPVLERRWREVLARRPPSQQRAGSGSTAPRKDRA
jgi:ribonuclease P protein component